MNIPQDRDTDYFTIDGHPTDQFNPLGRIYRQLFLLAPLGICISNEKGEFLYFNPRFVELVDYKIDCLKQTSYYDIFPLDYQNQGELYAKLFKGELDNFEICRLFTTPNCKTKTLKGFISVIQLQEHQPRHILTMVEDISDYYARVEKARFMDKMQVIGQLAGSIAHVFNNKMTGVEGYASLIQDHAHDEVIKQYASHISEAAFDAIDLTQKLLTFSRLPKRINASYDIHKLIHSCVELLKSNKQVEVNFKLNFKADHPVLMGDIHMIENTLYNVILNSCEAVTEGGRIVIETSDMTFSDSLCSSADDLKLLEAGYVCVSVKDNGCGMPKHLLSRVFEPFFTTKSLNGNLGLGLAAVYGAMQLHHGSVVIKSVPNQGTQVDLFFPIKEKKPQVPTECMVVGKDRILIVDDEEIIGNVVSFLLQDLGYSTISCKSGLEALTIYKKEKNNIDLILLDVVLPDMNGLDLLYTLQTIDPQVKVVLLVAYSLENEWIEVLRAGVKEVVTKPISLEDLRVSVYRALHG